MSRTMNIESLTDADRVKKIDELLSHVWMVRTFLKHSEEAEEDDELNEVFRTFYDYMLALGAPLAAGDHEKYLKQATRKFAKLKRATQLFIEIQPEISSHTNFQMAVTSARISVSQIAELLGKDVDFDS